jgi:hypothetical protein
MENEKVSAQAKVQILRNDFKNLERDINKHFESTDEKIDQHQEMLVNKGRGLMYRVAKLENIQESSDNRYAKLVSTLAVVLSTIAVILQILDRMK